MNSRGAEGCARRDFLRMLALALAAAGLPAGLRARAALALDDREVGRMARWAG